MAEKIFFNGKVYQSRAEMPSDIRDKYDRLNQIFSDSNQDGIPDLFQGKGLSGLKGAFGLIKEISQSSQAGQPFDPTQFTLIRQLDNKIVINGKEFSHPDEMPPDIRKVYDQITTNVSSGEPAIFDEPWREMEREAYFAPHDDEIINHRPEHAPVIEDVKTNLNVLVILGIVIIIALSGILLWFLSTNSLPGF